MVNWSYGYSATRTFDGKIVAVQGASSELEAVAECYRGMLEIGWRPQPLREHWWQIWRPSKYEPGLAEALKDG